MPVINDKELVKQMKSGEYSPVYYFYGKDILTIGKYASAISKKLVPEEDTAYNLHKFNGKELDLSELSDTVEALPMFADYVCVLVNDLNAEELSADDLKFLIDIVSGVGDGCVLVFYNTGIDVCGGKKSPTAKNKKLIDAVSKKGTVVEFGYRTMGELTKSVVAAAQKSGCDISSSDAEYLCALCLSDSMMITNEIRKLCDYVGNGTISRADIDALVSRQLDSNAFDLSKAVVRFNTARALELLDELFYQRAEPVAVLAAISMSFLDMYRAKLAKNKGIQSSQVVSDFGYKPNRKFAVDNAFRDVGNVSLSHLRFCMKVLAETDIALKSTRADQKFLIEKAIVEMSSKR